MKFLYFYLFLWVIFALLDPDPDPATQINADPCRSGSATLVSSMFEINRYEPSVNAVLILQQLTVPQLVSVGMNRRENAYFGELFQELVLLTHRFSLLMMAPREICFSIICPTLGSACLLSEFGQNLLPYFTNYWVGYLA
jgi:hypothetical protein